MGSKFFNRLEISGNKYDEKLKILIKKTWRRRKYGVVYNYKLIFFNE